MSTQPASELAASYAEGAMACYVMDGQVMPMIAFQYDQGEALVSQLADPSPTTVAKVVTTVIHFLPNTTHVTVVAPLEDLPYLALVTSFDLTWPGRGAWRLINRVDVPAGFVVEGSDDDPGEGLLVDYVRIAVDKSTDTRHDPPPGTTMATVLRALAEMDLIEGTAMSSDPRLLS